MERSERISVTVNDLIKLLDTKENKYGGITGKPRELNLSINGNFCGAIESIKLDGYGDGLITDVTLDIEVPEMEECYEREIRNETIEDFSCKLMNYFADCQLIEESAIVRDVLEKVIEKIDEITEQMKEV